MRFDVVTLFPDLFPPYLERSILKRASAADHISVVTHDLREGALDTHHSVDDTPYGGGAGMVLKVDVMDRVLSAVQAQNTGLAPEEQAILLMCPTGKRFTQTDALELARTKKQITFVCGHYEGFDERIRSLVTHEYSLGDFVLTGGELPALTIIDAVSRLLPGVIHEDSPTEESHTFRDPDTYEPLLEYPQYTRPQEYKGATVPPVLLSGNHAAIRDWRTAQARLRTAMRKQEDKLNRFPWE